MQAIDYPRPTGEGCLNTPEFCFASSQKGRCEAPIFVPTYSCSDKLFAPFVKILSPGHLGSGHQVKWPNLQKLCNRVRATEVEMKI